MFFSICFWRSVMACTIEPERCRETDSIKISSNQLFYTEKATDITHRMNVEIQHIDVIRTCMLYNSSSSKRTKEPVHDFQSPNHDVLDEELDGGALD